MPSALFRLSDPVVLVPVTNRDAKRLCHGLRRLQAVTEDLCHELWAPPADLETYRRQLDDNLQRAQLAVTLAGCLVSMHELEHRVRRRGWNAVLRWGRPQQLRQRPAGRRVEFWLWVLHG